MKKLDIINEGYEKYPEQYTKVLIQDSIDNNARKRIDFINKKFIENDITPLIICDPTGLKTAAKQFQNKFPDSSLIEAFIRGARWILSQGLFLPGTIYQWENGEFDVQTDTLLPHYIEAKDKEQVILQIIKL